MIKRYRGPRLRSLGYKRPSKHRMLRFAMHPSISMASQEMLELVSATNEAFAELP